MEIAGRYRIESPMKYVGETYYYRAVDVTTQTPITLRTINVREMGAVGEGLEDFAAQKLRWKVENEQRLVETLIRLKHPGLLQILDYGFDDPLYYHVFGPFVFENMQMRIEHDGRLPIAEALRIVRGAAKTLADLHRNGIIHCDVSAETILLGLDTPKIIEFTIANFAAVEGAVPGNPLYMSPEAIRGAAPTPARDIWALGATLYFAISGQMPYGAIEAPRETGVGKLFQRILRDAPAPQVDEFPPGVAALVQRMLDKDLARRVASMDEVAAQIDALG